MINWKYISKSFKDHFILLVFAFVLVGLLQYLILTLVVTADILNIIQAFVQQLPPQAQHLLGEEFLAQFSLKGAVAFGYNHPLVLVILALIAIHLPSKHIAGEVENGTLELLFSLPVKRINISISLWFFSCMMLLLVVTGCCLGTLTGMFFYPEARIIAFSNILKIGFNLWLLMLLINAYTFLIASFSKEGGKAALQAGFITLFFYFLNYVVKIWSAVDFLQPLTIFNYYQPQKIIMGMEVFQRNILILGILSIFCGALAIRRISTRDIPG